MPDVGRDLLGIARRVVKLLRRGRRQGTTLFGLAEPTEVLDHGLGVQPLVLGSMSHDVGFELRPMAVGLFGQRALGLTPEVQGVLDGFSATDHVRTAFGLKSEKSDERPISGCGLRTASVGLFRLPDKDLELPTRLVARSGPGLAIPLSLRPACPGRPWFVRFLAMTTFMFGLNAEPYIRTGMVQKVVGL